MSKWLKIRIKTEARKMKYVEANLRAFPANVTKLYFFQNVQTVSSQAVQVARGYMEHTPSNYTKTGEKRKAAGGNGPGRKDSGDMIKGFKRYRSSTIKDGQHYRTTFGWLEGTPGYSIFQEYGVEGGVKGMHALEFAVEFAKKELKLLGFNGANAALKGNVPKSFEGGERR